MPRKQTAANKSEPVTREFLAEQLDQQIGKVLDVIKKQGAYLESRIEKQGAYLESRIEKQGAHLESRIEFMRRDARDHLHSVASGLSNKIDEGDRKLCKRLDEMYNELKSTQLAVREVKSEAIEHTKRLDRIESKLDAVAEKVERHEGDIREIKATLSATNA